MKVRTWPPLARELTFTPDFGPPLVVNPPDAGAGVTSTGALCVTVALVEANLLAESLIFWSTTPSSFSLVLHVAGEKEDQNEAFAWRRALGLRLAKRRCARTYPHLGQKL